VKRFVPRLAVAGTLAGAAALALSGGAASASASATSSRSASASVAATLPTINVALTGKTGVSVTGTAVSGAVNVVSTFSGKGRGQVGLVRLNPGVSIQQAAGAVQSHHGDINALTPYGSLFVDAGAPSTVQTVLTPGNYVALNVSGNQPAFAPFTVTASSSPAALPRAKATQTALEFTFKGPKVLHNGTIVRAQNHGWLVHMIYLIGVRNAATGRKVMALLRAGKDHRAQKLASRNFVSLLGPASPGALQQAVLNAKPGFYVEACFMNTQDGREHTQLGMERLVRVVK
jgi:hypothetical protein